MSSYLVCIKIIIYATENNFTQYFVVTSDILNKIKHLNTDINCYGCGTNKCFVCANNGGIGIKYDSHIKITESNEQLVKFICQKNNLLSRSKYDVYDLDKILELLQHQLAGYSAVARLRLEDQDIYLSDDCDNSNDSNDSNKSVIDKIIDLYHNKITPDCLNRDEIVQYLNELLEEHIHDFTVLALAQQKRDYRYYHFFALILKHYGYDFLDNVYMIFQNSISVRSNEKKLPYVREGNWNIRASAFKVEDFNRLIEFDKKKFKKHILVDIWKGCNLEQTLVFIEKYYNSEWAMLEFCGVLSKLNKNEIKILGKYLKKYPDIILVKKNNKLTFVENGGFLLDITD